MAVDIVSAKVEGGGRYDNIKIIKHCYRCTMQDIPITKQWCTGQ